MSSRKKDPPDPPILFLAGNDQLTLTELIQDGPPIIGSLGSGKSSSLGKELARALMRGGLTDQFPLSDTAKPATKQRQAMKAEGKRPSGHAPHG
jgi:hypothetical protein